MDTTDIIYIKGDYGENIRINNSEPCLCGSEKNSRNVVRTKFLQLEFMVTGTNGVD